MNPEFCAFASYSGSDNAAQLRWITNFCEELKDVLDAKLGRRNGAPRPLHFYERNGPIYGLLEEELDLNVRRSAAMILFVHNFYLESRACQLELEAFSQAFGIEGFRKRLFIVAMSQDAGNKLIRGDHWRRIAPSLEPTRIDFFRRDERERPLQIYAPGKNSVLDSNFEDKFQQLVSALVRCNSEPLKMAASSVVGSTNVSHWIFGAVRDELTAEVERIALGVGQRPGHCVTVLKKMDLLKPLTRLAEGDRFVLGFNRGEPMFSGVPGGHLGMQQNAWIRAGKRADAVDWLDLEDIVPPDLEAASPESLSEIQRLTAGRVILRRHFEGPDICPSQVDLVRIYIESNSRELDQWDTLGDTICTRWSEIAQGVAPPVTFVHSALPVDHLDQYGSLEDADGFILLWGRKGAESLVAQIKQVEKRLLRNGGSTPPCIVAYLTPPQESRSEGIPAWGWKVLQFDAAMPQSIQVSKLDFGRLDAFLQKILQRVNRRRGVALAIA